MFVKAPLPCPECNGDGVIWGDPVDQTATTVCPLCNATGFADPRRVPGDADVLARIAEIRAGRFYQDFGNLNNGENYGI